MIKAEKYLKDNVSVEEMKKDFFDYLISDGVYGCNSKNIVQKWEDFLNMKIKPTLTEDERVILRNMTKPNIKAIGRSDSALYLQDNTGEKNFLMNYMYRDLFQFIKNGEEYFIEELLK